MGLLIKNRKMPKHLHECPMRTDCPLVMDGCFLLKDGEKRHEDCPIVGEIPDKNGRLIDADILEETLMKSAYPEQREWYFAEACQFIDEAPTVLEATK